MKPIVELIKGVFLSHTQCMTSLWQDKPMMKLAKLRRKIVPNELTQSSHVLMNDSTFYTTILNILTK